MNHEDYPEGLEEVVDDTTIDRIAVWLNKEPEEVTDEDIEAYIARMRFDAEEGR